MVSTNNSPPVAMPMHVPQGHMVQQVLDENGTLQHVILSPDPMGGAPGVIPGPMAGPPGPLAGSASPPTSTVTTSATNTSSSVAPAPSGTAQQFVPMTLYVSANLHVIHLLKLLLGKLPVILTLLSQAHVHLLQNTSCKYFCTQLKNFHIKNYLCSFFVRSFCAFAMQVFSCRSAKYMKSKVQLYSCSI